MPTSRQRKQSTTQGVRTTPPPPRGRRDKPGHFLTKGELIPAVANMLNMMVQSPAFTQVIQNIVEYGSPHAPVAPPLQPPQTDETPDIQRSLDEYSRANAALAGLEPERPSGIVVVSA